MKKLTSLLCSLLLVGCAVNPDKLKPTSSSSQIVEGSCTVISTEYNTLRKQERKLYKELSDNYKHDIAMVATSIIVFPIFFPSGTDEDLQEEYQNVKGKITYLESFLETNCIKG